MVKINDYLNAANEIVENGFVVKSPYVAALHESRGVTGRDIFSGKKTKDASHGNWLGAVGYMIILDHIGDKFYDSEKEEKIKDIGETKPFIRALAYFSELSKEEMLALYALRCSFIHDFFLFNINIKDKNLTHHFTVTQGEGKMVIMPKYQWDGSLENRNYDNMTFINLEKLGDLVEEIHKELLKLLAEEKLNLKPGVKLGSLTYKK